MLGNVQCRDVLLIWIIAGQEPTVLSVGAGGDVGYFFLRLSSLFSFSLSLREGPKQTEILSQRVVKSNTANQPHINPIPLFTVYLLYDAMGLFKRETKTNRKYETKGTM